jgi:DNA-binding response OmpR family regulator
MKRDVILLIDADAETTKTVGSVASELQLDVRFASSSVADCHLPNDLSDVALMVLDADRSIFGCVLPGLVGDVSTLPVVVVSSFEKPSAEHVLAAYRTQHHLAKPIHFDQLKTLVKQFLRRSEEPACRCDRWGHRCENCTTHELAQETDQITTLVEH